MSILWPRRYNLCGGLLRSLAHVVAQISLGCKKGVTLLGNCKYDPIHTTTTIPSYTPSMQCPHVWVTCYIICEPSVVHWTHAIVYVDAEIPAGLGRLPELP